MRPKDLPVVTTATAASKVMLDGAETQSITWENLFASATAANLSGGVTGTGAVVRATAPTLSDPVVGTQSLGDNSTKAASTAYVDGSVAAATTGVSSLNGQTGALDLPSICGLRPTLVSGTPVMTTDVTGATTIYATPANWAGKFVPLWNGSDLVPTLFGEVSQATTDATKSPAATVSNANYDIYAWSDGGTPRISRSDYWKKSSTITMTIATPAVVTWAGHGLASGTPIKFTTTGSLPSVTSTTFAQTLYVSSPTTNTFKLVADAANADVGAAELQTTGSQSGTHTGTAGDDTGVTALGSGGNCEADLTTSGLYLNTNAITNGPAALRGTLLGSVRTNSAGTVTYKLGGAAAGGDAAVLTVFSIYNPVDVAAEVNDTNANWNYTSATVVPMDNGGTGSGLNNRASILTRLQRDAVDVSLVIGLSTGSAVAATIYAGFALNSTSAFGATTSKRCKATTGGTSAIALTVTVRKIFKPLLGWNYIQALQQGDGTNQGSLIGGAIDQSLTLRTRM